MASSSPAIVSTVPGPLASAAATAATAAAAAPPPSSSASSSAPQLLGGATRAALERMIGASVLQIDKEVREALESGKGVVALESTIISHGMPYPQNVATARAVERRVRDRGAVPATIAIIRGVVRVGLDDAALEELGKAGAACRKCSRRDIAVAVAKGETGATTVSGTMLVAHLAGIAVFVTGGIGGVHRGGETTMDVSADLTELGRTPVAVVCAGAKSLLDIGRTLEFLETQGVTVAGFGTDDFPAFFVPTSGFKASCRLDSAAEAAKLLFTNRMLAIDSGVLLACPIPREHAAEAAAIEAAIQTALREAADQKIAGFEVTPFLLKRINELTGGESLTANIALIQNNATIGADIAVALAALCHPATASAVFARRAASAAASSDALRTWEDDNAMA